MAYGFFLFFYDGSWRLRYLWMSFFGLKLAFFVMYLIKVLPMICTATSTTDQASSTLQVADVTQPGHLHEA